MKKFIGMLFSLILVFSFNLLYADDTWIDREDAKDYQQIYWLTSKSLTEHIYIYYNQSENIYFQTLNLLNGEEAKIKIDDGNWIDVENDLTSVTVSPFNYIFDQNDHTLDLKVWWEDLSESIFTFTLHIVPPRQRFYNRGTGDGNFMSYWKGGSELLDRPILIVEGFDPSNTNYPSFYFFKGKTFFQTLLDNDADVFILDFANGGVGIDENAQIVKSAVKFIESITEGNEKIVLAGLSMGGVVCRYALAEAEDPAKDNDPLHVSTFLSIDSPQKFATIERDFQDFINENDDGDKEFALNCDAAKQMLIYNTYHNPYAHTDFYENLNLLNGDGYPHANEIRNIAVSFSPNIENPHVGEWAYVEVDGWYDDHFSFTSSDPEHLAGSWLPLENTRNWGFAGDYGFYFWYETKRTGNHPTFIPYKSALDMDANGSSKFDITLSSATHGFHDEFPTGDDTDGQNLINHLIDLLYLGDDSNIDLYCYNKIQDGRNAFGQLKVTGGTENVNLTVSSGNSVPVKANDTYVIETLEQKRVDYESEGIDYLHHDWNNDFTQKNLNHIFPGWKNGGKQTANFKSLEKPVIETDYTIDYIEFADPWYKESNGEQNNNFRPLSEVLISGKLEAFKENTPDNLKPEIPYYSVHAQNIIADNNNVYQFQSWDVTGAQLEVHPEHTSNPCYKAIVFNETATVAIKAVYTKINDIPNHTAFVYEKDYMSIPAGADITFAEGFTFDIQGSLSINGTQEQPVNLTGAGRASSYDPQSIVPEDPKMPLDVFLNLSGNNKEVNISHAQISNTYCGINIENDNNLIVIEGCEITNTNAAVLLGEFCNTQIHLRDVDVHDNHAGIVFNKNTGGEAQESLIDVYKCRFYDNNFGIIFSPAYNTLAGNSSKLNLVVAKCTFYENINSAFWARPTDNVYNIGYLYGRFVGNIFSTNCIFYDAMVGQNVCFDFISRIDDLEDTDYASLFIDAPNADFHLRYGSPAIGYLGTGRAYETIEYYLPYGTDVIIPEHLIWELDEVDELDHQDAGAFDYSETTLSGTISSDCTLDGTVTVESDITVNQGIELKFLPGTVIKLDPDVSITVLGKLTAQGTPENKITFTSTVSNPSTADYWGRIDFQESADNSSIVDNCKIEYADNGLWTYKTNVDVTNSEFGPINYTAIYHRYCVGNVTNNYIHDCDRGIFQSYGNDYGTGLIQNNIIENCDLMGIYLIKSSPYIVGNSISNSNYGIYCNVYSSPRFGAYSVYGNNQIHNNTYGLYAYSSSPFLGREYCDVNGGYNSFVDNSSYHLKTLYGSYIEAEENWWGIYPPDPADFINGSGCIIDIDYPLQSPLFKTSVPLTNSSAEESVFDATFGVYDSTLTEEEVMENYNPGWPILNRLQFARNLILLGFPSNAARISNEVLKTSPDSIEVHFALDILWQSGRAYTPEFEVYKIYLDSLAKLDIEKEIYEEAELLLEDYANDESLAKTLNSYQKYSFPNVAASSLFRDIVYHLSFEDTNAARLSYSILESNFPNTPAANEAGYLLNGSESLDDDISVDIPSEYLLLSNYPNPFNPETHIRFGIPEASNIDIDIFTVLGQKVNTLHASSLNAGYHELIWNGKNFNGTNLASGLYVYRIKALSPVKNSICFEKTGKMLLLK